jgi:hypothetical protein
LKPVAFQGADVTYKFTKAWTGELSYYDGFEDRVSSQFFRSTLLTYNPYDTPGQKSLVNVNGSTNATMTTNNGFFYGRLGYTGDHGLTGDLDYYSFSDIANFFWFDARQTFAGKLKPFVAAQFGSEKDTGAALVGKIDSTVFGLQGGVSVTPNVSVTLAYNDVPARSATVALAPANKGVANYFVANGGPDCVPAPSVNGLNYATVYYGGIASPYTDSYATDPLFTTSISQGMADRRYFGQAGKLSVNFVSNNRRLVALISRALYSYGNAAVGVQPTQETNIDATYFFSPVPKTGAYRGFLIRHRYAERTTDYTTAFGGVPLFKYNRTQLEYDF